MKKRIYGIVLALCTLLCIAHTAVAADVGGRSHTVTVRAAEHGKISVDGKNFSESISITVKDGQTLREALGSAAIEIQPDYAYVFDHFNTRDMTVSAVAVGTVNDSRHNVVVDRYGSSRRLRSGCGNKPACSNSCLCGRSFAFEQFSFDFVHCDEKEKESCLKINTRQKLTAHKSVTAAAHLRRGLRCENTP